MSREPTRLADLRDASSSLSSEAAHMGAVIRAQRGARASEEKMQELAGRLGPLLQRTSASPVRAIPWLGISLVSLSLIAGGAWVATRSSAQQAAVSLSPVDESQPRVQPPAEPAVIAVPPQQPPAAISVDALPNANVAPQAVRAPAVVCDEIELIDRADTKLRVGDAAGALAVVREHELRCSVGTLAQERERIAVEALAKLGRVGAAKTRARAFEASFPASPHLRRVHQVLEQLEQSP